MVEVRPTSGAFPPGRGRRAFTYVEVVIALGLMAVIMGSFAVALNSGSDSFVRSSVRGLLAANVSRTLTVLENDFHESSSSTVSTFADGLPEEQCLIVLASARDSDGVFHTTSTCRVDWQAAVVYCPYTTSQGVRQLRRYVYYDDSFAFPFQSCVIEADSVTLTDLLGSELVVDRKNGNPSAGPAFEVLCPALRELGVELDDPVRLSVLLRSVVRRGAVLEASGVSHVGFRN